LFLCKFRNVSNFIHRDQGKICIKEAQKEIEEITGVKRSGTQVREFLKKTQFPFQESRDNSSQSRSRKTEGVSGSRTATAPR